MNCSLKNNFLLYQGLIDSNGQESVSPLDILAEEHDGVVDDVADGDDHEHHEPEPEQQEDLFRHPIDAENAEVVRCLYISTRAKLSPLAAVHERKDVVEDCHGHVFMILQRLPHLTHPTPAKTGEHTNRGELTNQRLVFNIIDQSDISIQCH